jgi:hypothetical protein
MKSPTKCTSKRVIALLVCAVLAFCFIGTVSAQSTVVNAGASTTQPAVGSTLTVTITISNVQNLAGIDTTLTWNPSVLTLTNSVLNLGDSNSNGVLHGTNLNTDSNNLNSGDIYVQETKVSGSYELVAQSIGASNPGFTGSGTIVTLTFNVVSTGDAGLSLQTDLADHPAAGQTANNIDHQDTASSVTAVVAGSSSSPIPTSSASSTPNSSPSPTVPEFPNTALIIILIIAAAATITVSIKLRKNGAAVPQKDSQLLK